MQARRSFRWLPLVAAGLALAACEPGTMNQGTGFQKRYAVARTALEKGDYPQAIAGYQSLLQDAGPLEPRLRLEYAHALLRAERYAEAASVAGALADGQSGTARAAALAVRGTAEHQLARQAMAQGDYSASTLGLLNRADTAMQEMLALDPDLDPLDAMSDRRREIADEMALVRRRAG